jgi:2-methylcitrate dehydratase
MLLPHDFDKSALNNSLTRALMAKMTFEHGGTEYDAKYPDGIPTSIVIHDEEGAAFDSGLVMYPGGHARNAMGPDKIELKDVLAHKFESLARLAGDPKALVPRLSNLEKKDAKELARILDFPLEIRGKFD